MFKEYFKELQNLEIYEENDGFVLYKIEDGNLHIRHIYIKPEKRRTSLATRMADNLVAYAKQMGCTTMTADVEPSNKNATEATKVILSYGFTIAAAYIDEIIFYKEI